MGNHGYKVIGNDRKSLQLDIEFFGTIRLGKYLCLSVSLTGEFIWKKLPLEEYSRPAQLRG